MQEKPWIIQYQWDHSPEFNGPKHLPPKISFTLTLSRTLSDSEVFLKSPFNFFWKHLSAMALLFILKTHMSQICVFWPAVSFSWGLNNNFGNNSCKNKLSWLYLHHFIISKIWTWKKNPIKRLMVTLWDFSKRNCLLKCSEDLKSQCLLCITREMWLRLLIYIGPNSKQAGTGGKSLSRVLVLQKCHKAHLPLADGTGLLQPRPSSQRRQRRADGQ